MSEIGGRRFALLTYEDRGNLGDEIQSLAARRFLPRVDDWVDRELLDGFRSESGVPAQIILNGWFCIRPQNWPPSPDLRPLLVSFHLSPGAPQKTLLSEPCLSYLKKFGPVGARDLPTLRALQAANVPSWFSGCLTLTLERPNVARDDGLVILNDVPPQFVRAVAGRTRKRIELTTHLGDPGVSQSTRFEMAAGLLEKYASASCVITSRLHCALPCLAMGTPVLLIDLFPDQWRFEGLNSLLRHVDPKFFLENLDCFDTDNPTPNAELHIPYRLDLIERVTRFLSAPIEQPMPAEY
jgi:hypothetical protein